MNVRNLGTLALSALTCLIAAGSASATTVSGIVNVTGTVSVTATSITFAGNAIGPNGTATGSFSGFSGGTIKNLVGPPLTGNIFSSQFAVFNVAGITPVYFDLTSIAPGGSANSACNSTALNYQCTPTGSPFLLTNTAAGVSASLTMFGQAYTAPLSSGSSPSFGFFTTQLIFQNPTPGQPPLTIPDVINDLLSGKNTNETNVSFSATFSATPAPEPSAASLLLAGMGLLASSRLIRKYRG